MDSAYYPAHVGQQSHRRAVGLQKDVQDRKGTLSLALIICRDRRLVYARFADAAYHPDDRHPRPLPVRRTRPNLLPDRVLIREVLLRDPIVDDDDARLVGNIQPVEKTA